MLRSNYRGAGSRVKVASGRRLIFSRFSSNWTISFGLGIRFPSRQNYSNVCLTSLTKLKRQAMTFQVFTTNRLFRRRMTKVNRLRRGTVIAGVLRGENFEHKLTRWPTKD